MGKREKGGREGKRGRRRERNSSMERERKDSKGRYIERECM
jgi:hypothetical protein